MLAAGQGVVFGLRVIVKDQLQRPQYCTSPRAAGGDGGRIASPVTDGSSRSDSLVSLITNYIYLHRSPAGVAGIQRGKRLSTGWTPTPGARDNRLVIPPRPLVAVVRLSDHFGQYVLILKCECGHTRTAQPQTLAALAGWDALLADVVKRLRCSRCGRRLCSVTVRPETKRDGNCKYLSDS